MTGVFEGKNLIMIQLEAIDTWMLTEAYMPNLCAIKQGSMCLKTTIPPPSSPRGPITPSLW
jgi:hypothetical protein